MLKKVIFIFFLLFIISCNNNTDVIEREKAFEINGIILENQGFDKVYLSKISNNHVILLDSCEIVNEKFHFKGKVTFPTKSQIQFYKYGNFFPFILTGEQINIELNANHFLESNIAGSAINNEWNKLKNHSFEIYAEIDYLFPMMQKARMQNDFNTLQKINKKIDSLDQINREYLINYIKKNKESELIPLILNDLFHSSQKDSSQIKQISKEITEKQKKALDFN